MSRAISVVADTGYLLCFGSIARGTKMLGEMFENGVAAPPAVKAELQDQSTRAGVRPEVAAASRAYVNRNSGVLLDVVVCRAEAEHRVEVQKAMSQKAVPSASELATASARSTALGHAVQDPVPGALRGQHAGESESIAVAFHRSLRLLINEDAGTHYGRALKVQTECASMSLRRLVNLTAKQKYRLYREMYEKDLDPGRVPKGVNSYVGTDDSSF